MTAICIVQIIKHFLEEQIKPKEISRISRRDFKFSTFSSLPEYADIMLLII